jgi:hypothetical protein
MDDELLKEAKRYAVEHGETLTVVLERALRELLARSCTRTSREHAPLPIFHGGCGLRPGVDLDHSAHSASLLDLMEHPDAAS